jgi:4-diphosphocytidyl-2-C-methyl-D-erythritol kinase
MSSITLNAPAKINLYLDVLKKRKDSYHNISTIFCKLALSDSVTVSHKDKGISLTCNHPKLYNPRQNLAYKAVIIMKKKYNFNSGLNIYIEKNIPIAAGLGGGSSDAAAVMMAVNHLLKLNLSTSQLIKMGRAVGADVAFFLSGYNAALGRGIGDILEEIRPVHRGHIVLLVPNIHIYTKSIYKRLSLRLTKPHANAIMLARTLMYKDWPGRLKNSLYNRLEEVVLPLYPIAREGKQALSEFTGNVLLSGSGPSIFGIFKNRKEAQKAILKLASDKRWNVFLTRNV